MIVICIKTMDNENEHPFIKGREYDIDQPTAERLTKAGYLKPKVGDLKILEEVIKESNKK